MAHQNAAFNRRMDRAKSQGAVLLCGVMLSVDALNPVKLVTSVLQVQQSTAAYPFGLALAYLVLSQIQDIAFLSVRIFFTNILSIFFSRLDVIGHSNVPFDGPLILTGNHSNQFVDAFMVLTSTGHKVGFLIALKSWKQPVVGFFARIMACIPVMRPQDAAIKRPATELIRVKGEMVTGRNTSFRRDVDAADKIRFRGISDQLKIKAVNSDTELILMEPAGAEYEALGDANFDVLKYVDQSKVFDKVHDQLAKGRAIAIFPEGGSHDRTDLLPLKVGVAVIAFGALEQHNIMVPVVPIGMNYYRGHRFRGRAVVEFGPAIRISEELFELYKKDKRTAYTQFLMQVENGMRGCIVTTPDYNSLQLVYTARRLFQKGQLTPDQKQDLNRRFAEGYKILLKQYESGELPQEGAARNLKARLLAYREKLGALGLRDYQVPTMEDPSLFRISYTFVHLLLVFLLASVPSLVLNAPVGLVARLLAAKERKKALAGSVVKVHGRDVMMSKKIITAIVMVPVLWVAYAVLLLALHVQIKTVVLLFLCMPLFSYAGVVTTQAGMVDLKDLKPMLMRLRPTIRAELEELKAERMALQRDLRAFVKEVGPSLGPIYNDNDIGAWSRLRANRSEDNLEAIAAKAAHAMEPSKYAEPASPPRVSEGDGAGEGVGEGCKPKQS